MTVGAGSALGAGAGSALGAGAADQPDDEHGAGNETEPEECVLGCVGPTAATAVDDREQHWTHLTNRTIGYGKHDSGCNYAQWLYRRTVVFARVAWQSETHGCAAHPAGAVR